MDEVVQLTLHKIHEEFNDYPDCCCIVEALCDEGLLDRTVCQVIEKETDIPWKNWYVIAIVIFSNSFT